MFNPVNDVWKKTLCFVYNINIL